MILVGGCLIVYDGLLVECGAGWVGCLGFGRRRFAGWIGWFEGRCWMVTMVCLSSGGWVGRWSWFLKVEVVGWILVGCRLSVAGWIGWLKVGGCCCLCW